MKFPKKQAQRLIPEYLLDYTTKLNESHPDPTQSWGGGSGGSEYTAGDGIDITNNVISVDNTIAKKSDIPSLDGYATQTWVQEQGYKTSITSSDITNALGYTPGTSNFSGSYNDLLDKPDLSIYAQSSNLSTVATTGSYNDLLDKPTIPDTTNLVTTDTNQTITGAKTFQNDALKVENTLNGRTMTYDGFGFFDLRVNNQGTIERIKFELPTYKPKGTEDAYTQYTLAALDDIPTKTSELDNDSGFITNVTWGIITDKPTFATVATSGSYNDLTDKPYIFPSSRIVDTDTNQDITGTKTFEGLIKVRDVTHAQTTSIFPNEFDYTLTSPTTNEKTRTKFKLPTSKPSGTEQEPTTYTLSTTDDIPTVNNPTITFTQGGTTKGTITLNQSGDQTIEFDAGGGGGSTTNMVTTDTNQDITGEKTFVGTKRIKFKQHYADDKLGFTGFDANGTEIGYLEMTKSDRDFTGNPTSNILGYWSNINSSTNPSSDAMLGFKYFTKDSDGNTRNYKLVVPPRYNETNVTRYIPISVNGNTADNTGNINVPTETLVFTLNDNSTVTVNVMTSATSSTTNTL